MIVYTSKREVLQLAELPFASGGEGAIYKVVSSPAHLQDVCVKLYHPHILNKEREDRVKYMVQNPPEKIRDEGFLLGWPMEYVTDDAGRFLGFVMPLGFPASKELVALTATTLSKSLGLEWQDRYDRSLGKKALLSRLKLICNIAIPVHILHSTGKYVLKDFKPQNVLATADGRITICDMDSIQIAEGGSLLFPGTAATAEYIPPECYTKGEGRQASDVIQPSWDSFAIGTVFYQLLFGIHPYVVTPKTEQGDGSNDISHNISSGLFPFGVNGDEVKVRPKLHDKFLVLPEPLQDLFMRTFSEDAESRPSAEEWGKYMHDVVVNADSYEEKNEPFEGDKKDGPSIETTGVSSQVTTPTGNTNLPNKEVKKSSNKTWLVILSFVAAILLIWFFANKHKYNAMESVIQENVEFFDKSDGDISFRSVEFNKKDKKVEFGLAIKGKEDVIDSLINTKGDGRTAKIMMASILNNIYAIGACAFRNVLEQAVKSRAGVRFILYEDDAVARSLDVDRDDIPYILENGREMNLINFRIEYHDPRASAEENKREKYVALEDAIEEANKLYKRNIWDGESIGTIKLYETHELVELEYMLTDRHGPIDYLKDRIRERGEREHAMRWIANFVFANEEANTSADTVIAGERNPPLYYAIKRVLDETAEVGLGVSFNIIDENGDHMKINIDNDDLRTAMTNWEELH